jgi:ABC-type iron transport system FetAB permease component
VSVAPGSVFNVEDWLVVALFIAVMLAIALYAMRSKVESEKDYSSVQAW